MRAPSVKRLVETFDIDAKAAHCIRTLCHACDNAPQLEDYIAAHCLATRG